jgi:hypothetical protein
VGFAISTFRRLLQPHLHWRDTASELSAMEEKCDHLASQAGDFEHWVNKHGGFEHWVKPGLGKFHIFPNSRLLAALSVRYRQKSAAP